MINNKPFFSVVIPTLNEEKYIPTLLKCLTAQSYKDFEVIVCDGHSNDKTVQMVEKFNKKFTRLVVFNSTKRNVCYQRNMGAKNALGKYLVFFDADCAMNKSFLKKIHEHIKKEESLLMTTWLDCDSTEMVDEMMMLVTNLTIELARHTPKAVIPGFNIIIDKGVFWVMGGFDEKVIHAEDLYFAQKARKKGIALRFLREPSLIVSLRRFRNEGRLEVFHKYVRSVTHVVFKGPIYNKLFDYKMGGGHYELKKSEKI